MPLISFTGEMSEWSIEHAWKACVPKRYRGFESHSLRKKKLYEMEEFRMLFKQWIASLNALEDEDYKDEWGLFNRKK